MTRALLIDWLGRGGIAQTSESWVLELTMSGVDVRVVTRSDRELGARTVAVRSPRERRSSILSHAALCRFAVREIRSWRPDVVIIQNYVIPAMEDRVHRAAASVGAHVVFVVHDHRHHEWREGSHLGLEGQIRRADEVVVHSAAVGEGVTSRPTRVLPHPVYLGLAGADGPSPIRAPEGDERLALHFGVLNRAYKGVDTTIALATEGVDGWAFAFAGVGAPACAGAQSVDRYLEPGELVAAVRTADAVLLPYRSATQSGAVTLAQMLGAVPIASAVGGVSERSGHGVTGLLVPPGASPAEWRAQLLVLADDDHRQAMATAANAAMWQQHQAFRDGVNDLLPTPVTPGC